MWVHASWRPQSSTAVQRCPSTQLNHQFHPPWFFSLLKSRASNIPRFTQVILVLGNPHKLKQREGAQITGPGWGTEL